MAEPASTSMASSPTSPRGGHQPAAAERFSARCARALPPDTVPPPPPQPPSTLPAPPPPSLPPAPVAEQLIWEGTPHGLLNPIESHAIRWELTTERLRVVRGLLNRSTEEVELTRVRDVSCEQSLAQRALGIGNVTVVSADT